MSRRSQALIVYRDHYCVDLIVYCAYWRNPAHIIAGSCVSMWELD